MEKIDATEIILSLFRETLKDLMPDVREYLLSLVANDIKVTRTSPIPVGNDGVLSCPQCNEKFETHRHGQIFCTPDCRVAYHNDRKTRRAKKDFADPLTYVLAQITNHNPIEPSVIAELTGWDDREIARFVQKVQFQ